MKRYSNIIYRFVIQSVITIYIFFLKCFCKFSGKKNLIDGNEVLDILLTGRFYSVNWVNAHLLPLSLSDRVGKIYIVSTSQMISYDKIKFIIPNKLIILVFGETIARFITCTFVAIKKKPHIIGGFHLLVNGLVALLLARIVGAKALYNCGGGVREVLGGGFSTENRIFRRLKEPDVQIEKKLLEAVAMFDFIIVRGNGALNFFKKYARRDRIFIVTGGIDGKRFFPRSCHKKYDLILTGRLSEVKRVDCFVRTVEFLVNVRPEVKAVIVGDGPLFAALYDYAESLGLQGHIDFVGHQDHVEDYLRQSKIFVLTSSSEGLSLALIEAMLCGLPAVVPDVGDLGDLVRPGRNGFLITDREPKNFAMECHRLLNDPELLRRLGASAREDAKRCELCNVAKLWTKVLGVND